MDRSGPYNFTLLSVQADEIQGENRLLSYQPHTALVTMHASAVCIATTLAIDVSAQDGRLLLAWARLRVVSDTSWPGTAKQDITAHGMGQAENGV